MPRTDLLDIKQKAMTHRKHSQFNWLSDEGHLIDALARFKKSSSPVKPQVNNLMSNVSHHQTKITSSRSPFDLNQRESFRMLNEKQLKGKARLALSKEDSG